jgi:murein DD-endopeptidase MepM/ murein hydrolase activator NlpD
MAEVRGKAKYIFKKDNRYYDQKARSLTNYLFKVPLRYNRISSKFSLKRWHPILKKYRAHLGIDYAAPTGTKVRASADGKVIFKGRKGGYGKVIIIRHKDGLKTLYAHLSRFRAGLRVGKWVHQGNYIGNVGSTGRSTGPHLHFGLYKNNRAINPAKMVVVAKTKLRGKKRRDFIKYAKKSINKLKLAVKEQPKPIKIDTFTTYSTINHML